MNNDMISQPPAAGPPSGPPFEPSRPRRGRRPLVVAGVSIAAALAIGGGVAAAASSAPSPSPSPSSPAPSGSAAPERPAHKPHLAGTVVSASGGSIVITDREGFQRTIHTNGSTTYADGLTATPAAGTKIFATGTVDSDKTSLLATEVRKAPERPEGGPGRGGPGGHRGWPGHGPGDRPGGQGPGKPDPSGTPPAPPSGAPSSPAPSTSPSTSPSASPTS